MNNKKESIIIRDSTFELVRIVAIVLITFHHVLVHGLGCCNYNVGKPYYGTFPFLEYYLNSAGVIGVNLFILISGWFGIKSIRRSISRLIPTYIIVVLLIMVVRHSFSSDIWWFKHWWYVPNFIALIFLSPIIEQSIVNITFKTFSFNICCLTFVNVVLGWFLGFGNIDGFNYINFVYLYYLGRYFKMYHNNRYVLMVFKYGIYIFLICSLLLALGYEVVGTHFQKSVRYWAYNNPLVIISSCSFFAWMSCFTLKSRIINFIGGGTFAVYLVSTKLLPYGIYDVMMFKSYSYIGVVIYVLIITLIMYIPSSVVNWILKKILWT